MESNVDVIKQNKDKLEKDIKALLEQFIEYNGMCDINISSQLSYNHPPHVKKKILTGIEVEVIISIYQ